MNIKNKISLIFISIFVHGCNIGDSNFSNSIIPGVIQPIPVAENVDYCPSKQPYSYDNYSLTWLESFDDDILNQSNWTFMYGNGQNYGIPGWGNNELQNYTDSSENIYLNDGCLFIIPTYTSSTGGTGYKSGRINTQTKKKFKYGRIDISFSVPEITGVWPALWMMPEKSVYGNWPRSGEIDIVETINEKSDELVTTIHYGFDQHRQISKTTFLNQLTKLSNPIDHNKISLIWEDKYFEWFLNDQLIFKVNFDEVDNLEPNPFLEEFYLLINVAVGGNWPGPPNSTMYCNSRKSCPDVKKLIVDYIAYYEKIN